MSKKIIIDKEWLYEEYIVKRRKSIDIAKELNCSKWCVNRNVKTFGFKRSKEIYILDSTKKFGKLKILEQLGSQKFLCECDCGNKVVVNKGDLNSGNTKSCGCLFNQRLTNIGEISGHFWQHTEKSAKNRNIPFLIDINTAWQLFLNQNGRCAYTNVKLTFYKKNTDWVSQTASLDRIDSKKPYILGNVQWVHKDINRIKWSLPENVFIEWCNKVHENQINKSNWDKRFLLITRDIANLSKDPSTRVGSLIVDKDRRIVSTGYNGFPRGVKDDERLLDREQKLKIIIHAEENALLFAKQSLEDCTIYTWPIGPCTTCASYIIQAGIKRVVFPPLPEHMIRWQESISLSKQIFSEAGVNFSEINLLQSGTKGV